MQSAAAIGQEPETFNSIFYFNQHYTYAPGAFCYALSTAGMSTATGQESSTELLAKAINNPTNRSYLGTVANFLEVM